MNTLTGPWITTHGLKKLEQELFELRHWLNHFNLKIQRTITDHKKDKEIALILSEERGSTNQTKHVNGECNSSRILPAVMWGHKAEVRVGDTVYLRHNDNIRALLLTTAWNAEPASGKVSVLSPIGSTLIGRHSGDKVRINTLDGNVEYKILKIV